MPAEIRIRVGIDTGGTFTDFVVSDGARLRTHKLLSTPEAPQRAILQGLEELGLMTTNRALLQVIHGSTVATNATLEGKGARTAFITNSGFEDLLLLGRQARTELYNLTPKAADNLFPHTSFFGIASRRAADGTVLAPLTTEAIADVQRRLDAFAPEAMAICLLFSYRDPSDERALAEALVPGCKFVATSAAVLPRYGEYERGIATWLTAFLGPLVEDYVEHLGRSLEPASCAIMQSSGRTLSVAHAARSAAHLLLSGPAGGVAAAADVAIRRGQPRLLTFDMGGTSTDVSLLDDGISLTNDGRIGPYPIAIPMIDIHTIGAGGGSLGWLDAGGMLRVGPKSAGANPGPACYMRGGEGATVTDANLHLGRLAADAFLGGNMRLDRAAATAALERLGKPLGMDADQTALGVIRIVNENMAQALRRVSLEKGRDPRNFILCGFGGAGGLHICALSASLGMDRVVLPGHAGVFSAVGMLAAAPGRELTQSLQSPVDDLSDEIVVQGFEVLAGRGRTALVAENVAPETIQYRRTLSLRYLGQSHALEIAWTSLAEATREFEKLHRSLYGHCLQAPVELVDLHLSAFSKNPGTWAPKATSFTKVSTAQTYSHCVGYGRVPVLRWTDLTPSNVFAGPAIIVETASTTFLEPGWTAELDDEFCLWLQRQSTDARNLEPGTDSHALADTGTTPTT